MQVRVRVRFSRKPTSSTVSTDLKSKGKIRVSTSDVSGRARTAAKDERRSVLTVDDVGFLLNLTLTLTCREI